MQERLYLPSHVLSLGREIESPVNSQTGDSWKIGPNLMTLGRITTLLMAKSLGIAYCGCLYEIVSVEAT